MTTDGATPRGLIDLPADVVGLKILYHLTLAHEIAKTAPTCRLLGDGTRGDSIVRTYLLYYPTPSTACKKIFAFHIACTAIGTTRLPVCT